MSGQEYESAAEKIVENYMGEYMDQYMQVPGSREVQRRSTCLQEWYVKYCAETGEFCDQIRVTHTHNSHNSHEDEAEERPPHYTYGEHLNEMKMNYTATIFSP